VLVDRDTGPLADVAAELRRSGATVEQLTPGLATRDGVARVTGRLAARGRPRVTGRLAAGDVRGPDRFAREA
jgi:hypothetical protein